MKILGIITARGGSKRIPKKNIYPLGNIPLICHCLKTARKSNSIDRLVVSTDDEEIALISEKEGVKVLKRPEELARDNTPSLEVIKYTIEQLDKTGLGAEIILTLQPTYPFLTTENIQRVIRAFSQGEDFDSVTTVIRTPFKFHPYNARKINPGEKTISFMFPEEKKSCFNSQSAPPIYFFGNLVASRRNTIFDKNSLYGDQSFPVEIDSIEGFDIDDLLDLEMAEWLINRKKRG